ncbi:ABC transporter ATP-binding protein [Desulfacinum hydrothermale]|uniref:ABC transporter ATP-binding protein n=1 Tax=Desulfacinum hydrothermale TaxID=109258 RepID=UPI001481DC85|nr:ABC transporter ATP-binding protein [Desulfacinum hydrothermale]
MKPFLRHQAGRLAAGFAALWIVDLLQVWIPRVIKHAVDALARPGMTQGRLFFYGAEIAGLALLIAVFRYLWRILLLGFSRLLERDLRHQMVERILYLDRTVFSRRSTGDFMALSGNDLASVQLACGMGLVAFADAVIMSLAALAFMAYIHPVLTVVATAPMPLLAFATRFLSARLHRRFMRVQELFSQLTERARSTFSSIHLYKAYTQEEAQCRRFDAVGRAYIRNNLKVALVQGTLFPFAGLTANASLLLVLFFGGRLTLQGVITTGDFVAFIAYLHLLTWPMMAFGWVANLFQRGLTSLGRIQGLMEERPALQEPPNPLPPPQPPVTIQVHGFTFAYPGRSEPALRRVHITLPVGVTGLVGPTGSGKSTLCQVLARLYPIEDGAYRINGTDVNRLNVADVRRLIAYVPQDGTLFSDTIAANIALGRPEASRQEIEDVARAAAIHHEITAMEHGYETRIGEKGVRLSGGQRQRIALARALLLDRPVLLIDDGLSAVDLETERAILRAIKPYLEGRTCLIVSHRVAALAGCDRIVVLDRGVVADQGSHDQLMERNLFYRTIALHQTQ